MGGLLFPFRARPPSPRGNEHNQVAVALAWAAHRALSLATTPGSSQICTLPSLAQLGSTATEPTRPGGVKDDRARPKVAAMSRLSILAQGGSYGLGSATKEKAMKFEMIIQAARPLTERKLVAAIASSMSRRRRARIIVSSR